MKIIISKTNEIHSADEWYRYAPPKRSTQWRSGRSAKLLAEYATTQDFVKDISAWTDEYEYEYEYKKSEVLKCEPEAVTSLPGQGDGCNHDLLITGDDFMIGVEAKVSETFGKEISEELKDASENKKKRISTLLSYINQNPQSAGSYRYQLLTGLTGTLLATKKKGKQNCLFLIIVFTGDVDIPPKEQKNIAQNDKDYELFCTDLLGLASEGGTKDFTIDNKTISCTIKKVTVEKHTTFTFSKG